MGCEYPTHQYDLFEMESDKIIKFMFPGFTIAVNDLKYLRRLYRKGYLVPNS